MTLTLNLRGHCVLWPQSIKTLALTLIDIIKELITYRQAGQMQQYSSRQVIVHWRSASWDIREI